MVAKNNAVLHAEEDHLVNCSYWIFDPRNLAETLINGLGSLAKVLYLVFIEIAFYFIEASIRWLVEARVYQFTPGCILFHFFNLLWKFNG